VAGHVADAQRAIRAAVVQGQILTTPARRSPFSIGEARDDGIAILIGARKARTLLRWDILEGLVQWLGGRDWVEMGGGYTLTGRAGTLDGYLKDYIKRDVAGWVAALLAEAGLIEIRHERPTRVRLAATSAASGGR
jgi:hypothetical protein